MEIILNRYNIISTGEKIQKPAPGDQVDFTVKPQKLDGDESFFAKVDVTFVMSLGTYVYLKGSTILDGKEMSCNASYYTGDINQGENLGELIGKEVVE